MFKNLVRVLLALGLLAPWALAQNSAVPVSGSITSSSASCPVTQGPQTQCVFYQVPPSVGQVSITVESTPTFVANLNFEWSPDGGNTWVSLAAIPNGGGAAAIFTNASGVWTASVGGATFVRVRASAYTSGTASVVINPGQASAAAGSGNAPTSTVVDPCASATVTKSHTFANITTAATTPLVTSSGSTVIYVCAYVINMTGTTTADTLLFEYGGGASCGTGTTQLTQTFNSGILTQGATVISAGGGFTLFATAASARLCAVSTVGTSPTIGVDLTYVQQ